MTHREEFRLSLQAQKEKIDAIRESLELEMEALEIMQDDYRDYEAEYESHLISLSQ